MKWNSVIVHIPKQPLEKCKENVQAFKKTLSGFKEMGGYLIGSYDGNFTVNEFILDSKSEATGTRIKLSAECFQQVQEILAKQPNLCYIGTWHVHPGKTKPTFSHTDESTLFLEKLVIKTDNPKEYRTPRIHLIFSEDLQLISAYTMHLELDYELFDLWKVDKNIQDSDVDRADEVIERLQRVKTEFQRYEKTQKLEILEDCFYELGEIRREVDQLIDITEEISDFQETLQLIRNEKKNIEKQIKAKLKAGAQIGIIIMNTEQKIDLLDYRPNLLNQHQEAGALIGFWKNYPQEKPPIELQEIFLTNFFMKIGEDYLGSCIYILSNPTGITFSYLKITEFSGISFEEVEIALEEVE